MAVIYTHNQSANPPHVFVVDVASGNTVGEFNVTTPSADVVKNPQAVRLDWTNSDLYLADIGDPQANRTDIALWKVKEPGPGIQTFPMAGVRYPISYPTGPCHAEALAIHPTTGVQYIITHEASGRLFQVPKPLTGTNVCTNTNKVLAGFVTDACFTLDGKWLLVRCLGVKDTLVYNGSTFLFDGYITTPQVAEGRSITIEPGGKSFLIGSEGKNSPIFRIVLPAKYTFGTAPPSTPPPSSGDPKPGLLANITDSRLREISGMAYSKDHSGVVWVHNDEGENPQVYGVSITTGNVVATYGVSGSALHDPEAIRVHPTSGAVWLADIGDNDSDRTDRRIVVTNEPPLGNSGTLSSVRYPITYPQGPQNAEALLIHPTTGTPYIITKHSSAGRLYRIPLPMSTGGNTLVNMNKAMPANVSDATFTTDGRFVFIRCAGVQNTLVYNASTWSQVGSIATPALFKGESITVEPGGKSFLVGSESASASSPSPIYRVLIPAQWRPSTQTTDCSTADTPGDILTLTNWKLTLPIGQENDPTEIFQPTLRNYEHPQYFFVVCPDNAVVFRAPTTGVTTGKSSNPRSELREMKSNGSQNASWNMGSGTHTMTIVQAITHRPDKNDGTDPVVAGQIHDDGDDVTVARLHGSNIVATVGDKVSGSVVKVIYPNYKLGTYFTLKIVAYSGGVQYWINGVLKTTVSMSTLKSNDALADNGAGCYFKAGCYTQANTSNGTGYGEVRIKSVVVTHT